MADIVTCLAKEFGWTRHYILSLYWEEVWIYFKKIQNDRVVEWNGEHKFQYFLHGNLHIDSKSSGKWKSNWKDLKLPFPGKKKKQVGSSNQHALIALKSRQKIFKVKRNGRNRKP